MLGSAVLDTAVGLILIYFLLATIVAQLQEFMAGQFAWRAKFLADGVRRMLPHDKLGERVLKHPLITGLASHREGPSYIPATVFATAVFEAIAPASADHATPQ